ncbi:unnamed protein product [Boreogadus saida]
MVRTTEKEEEAEGVESSEVVRLVTAVRERRVEAHGYMWGQEDHSHWRSLIHQPQTAELSRSSGGRGSDELRRQDQQDVRIRWGSAQVCLPPSKQDQVKFSSAVSARTKQGHGLGRRSFSVKVQGDTPSE